MSSEVITEPWCVWALLPNKKGPDGFSMILNGMTQSEAERAEECSTFRARAMEAGKSASFKPAALETPPVGTRGPHPLDEGVRTHVTVDAAAVLDVVDTLTDETAERMRAQLKPAPTRAPAAPVVGQGVSVSIFKKP